MHMVLKPGQFGKLAILDNLKLYPRQFYAHCRVKFVAIKTML